MTLKIYRVLIVPGFGHSDNHGDYDRGRSNGPLSELDVVDGYLRGLQDELSGERVPYEIVNTRVKPGTLQKDRVSFAGPGHLVLDLRGGWSNSKEQDGPNMSKVHYSTKQSRQFATHVSETLRDWGKCFVYGHQCPSPLRITRDAALLQVPNSVGVRIEPFAINGKDWDQYAAHLEALGRALGVCAASFVKRRSQ